jgi:IS30 family transposase
MYLPDTAQAKTQQRRQSAKTAFIGIPNESIVAVKAGLQQSHSPEQIAGRLKQQGQPTVSHETIYQMIYRDYQGMGGYAVYLRQSHLKRQKRSSKQSKRGVIPNRVGIEQRPSIAEEKTQIGHWEGDTIIGANHLGAIATHVDKASKFLVARVMKDRTAVEMNRVSIAAFREVSADKRRTFTFDNGKEFSKHEQMAKVLGVDCYFANPYHS